MSVGSFRTRGFVLRMMAAGLGLAAGLAAAPPLTTIQDVLYKADGKRFDGMATIAWPSFESSDASAITMHSLTVKIVNGQLRVQLVPNANATPAAPYRVKYSSAGKIQFEEIWSVPASGAPLRVRDVRSAAPPSLETGTTIRESDVEGLTADLNARPVRGPGFTPGRTAVISASGALEAAIGDPADCVRVDGTTGPCGTGGGYSFSDNESPTGIVDGANADFSLAGIPKPANSLAVYRNGMLLKAAQDYTLNGRVVSFVPAAIPQPGDTLLASYRRESQGASPAAPQVLCSGSGLTTGAAEMTLLGQCDIPAGTLQPGDRVVAQFDVAHTGTEAGFTFQARWGATLVAERTAEAAETLVAGRLEGAIADDGAQIGVQTWGGALPLAAGVVASGDTGTAAGVAIQFHGALAAAGTDTLKLRQFTVVRYPGLQ